MTLDNAETKVQGRRRVDCPRGHSYVLSPWEFGQAFSLDGDEPTPICKYCYTNFHRNNFGATETEID